MVTFLITPVSDNNSEANSRGDDGQGSYLKAAFQIERSMSDKTITKLIFFVNTPGSHTNSKCSLLMAIPWFDRNIEEEHAKKITICEIQSFQSLFDTLYSAGTVHLYVA